MGKAGPVNGGWPAKSILVRKCLDMSDPNNNLPPVQPPSVSFLMQLFVVPMAIVVVIVLVCLMFNWLAHLGTTPQDLVDDLSKLNPGSWQKALTVANMLTDTHHAELRRDAALAQRLADVLNNELDAGNREPQRIKLRVYLCRALGVFEVDEGLPELIKAVDVQRDPVEVEVQLAALEAIAQRVDVTSSRRNELSMNESLMALLDQVDSQFSDRPDQAERDAKLRERATFVYGVLGGDVALEQLATLLSDPHPTVRYNAAAGLSRYGDARAIPRLLEMFELTGTPVSENGLDDFTRKLIMRNAFRATLQLAEKNENADVSELQQKIQQLADNSEHEFTSRIALDAKMTIYKLSELNRLRSLEASND